MYPAGGCAHDLPVFRCPGCGHHVFAPLAARLAHGDIGSDGHRVVAIPGQHAVHPLLRPPCRGCWRRMEHAALLCRI